MRSGWLAIGLFLGVAGFGGEYEVYVATRILVFALAALGLDLVVGWCGQVSLGHAAFLGLGAYTHALASIAGAPTLVSVPIAMGVGAVAGATLALPALRLSGPYLAVASLAFGAVWEQLWIRSGSWTGGRMGLPVAEIAWRFPYAERGRLIVYAALVGGVMQLTSRVLEGTRGRALIALREQPEAAGGMGIDPAPTRFTAFVSSAALTSLAGALYVDLADTLHPDQFSVSTSLELLVIVVLGGVGSVRGALLGATALGVLQALLGRLADLQTAALGGLLLLIVLAAPKGLRRWMPAS